MTFIPAFVSEFPDNPVDDCVPASGVMLANKVTHNKYPASIAEREALAGAMGTEVPGQVQGADAQQLCDGMKARYGLALVPGNGWSVLAGMLATPNKGAAIFGEYPKLPAYIRNRGNQPTFAGGHCLYAQGDGAGGVVIGDPLGNAMIPGAAINDLSAFAGLPGSDMFVPATELPAIVGYRVYFGPGLVTLYKVMRFTHILYGARTTNWDHQTHAPAAHGSPGFWLISAGAYAGYYCVYGHTQGFSVRAVYNDGSLQTVAPNS